jgi:hypothetical protein
MHVFQCFLAETVSVVIWRLFFGPCVIIPVLFFIPYRPHGTVAQMAKDLVMIVSRCCSSPDKKHKPQKTQGTTGGSECASQCVVLTVKTLVEFYRTLVMAGAPSVASDGVPKQHQRTWITSATANGSKLTGCLAHGRTSLAGEQTRLDVERLRQELAFLTSPLSTILLARTQSGVATQFQKIGGVQMTNRLLPSDSRPPAPCTLPRSETSCSLKPLPTTPPTSHIPTPSSMPRLPPAALPPPLSRPPLNTTTTTPHATPTAVPSTPASTALTVSLDRTIMGEKPTEPTKAATKRLSRRLFKESHYVSNCDAQPTKAAPRRRSRRLFKESHYVNYCDAHG